MKINICADVLQDLLEAVEAAIQAGDWKVDGACDPDLAIRRAKETLARPEQDRTWVGLTDAEMAEIWENSGWYVSMFKAIEAKLKEKNT